MRFHLHRGAVFGLAAFAILFSLSAQDETGKIEQAIGDLQNSSSDVRRRATVVLLESAPGARQAIPALTVALADSSRDVRLNAAEAIGLMGLDAASAVPALIEAVKRSDRSGNAQVMAAWALAQVGPTAKEAVPALIELLSTHEQPTARREAALTLAAIGPDAVAALPALNTALADENGFVRVAAATALCKVGQDTSGISLIVDGLKDQAIVGTRVAADALAEIGPAARGTVPALTDALGDPAASARVAAARALWLIERNTAGVPALIAALEDPFSAETRERAADTLGLVVEAKETGDRQAGAPDRADLLRRTAEALAAYEKRIAAPPSGPTTLVFDAEDWSGPATAILKDQYSASAWVLKAALGGMVLVSPPVLEDRATPEEGAPVLHTRITGIANGRYDVTVSGYRPLAVSADAGKTWRRIDGDRSVGVFEITDGTFDLWVDDRYAETDEAKRGPSYYDALTFAPYEKTTVATVHGWAKERVRERLARGVDAVRLADGGVYVNWRLLDDDPEGVAFDVYRQVPGQQSQRVNDQPILRTTDFVDRAAPPNQPCQYTVTLAGQPKDRVPSPSATARPTEPPYMAIKFQGDYQANQVAIADLTGDGRYDYIIKKPGYIIWKLRYLWRRSTETYKLEAYDADGKFLWRYDMGWGIELEVSKAPFSAYDLDGDGRAEVFCMAGPPDPRDANGHVEHGPHDVVVIDGLTGKVRCRAPWPSQDGFTPQRAWHNQLCVAYLDGKTPCLILARGIYNLQKVWAYQLRAGQLELLWNWNNLGAGKEYWGQGAHTIHAADMDGDGRDEVVLGSSVLDDDGSPLWSTGLGHIDQCFVGDIDPLRPGLEMFYVAEEPKQKDGIGLVDAATGKLIWGYDRPTNHVGFGLVADIDPTCPGSECSAAEDPKGDPKGRNYNGKAPNWLFSAAGELLAENSPREAVIGTTTWGGASRAAWWDADMQREILAKNRICRYGGGTCPPVLEGDMLAVADVTGDWREEILTTVPGELRIYSTRIPARDRRPSLMQDPIYRLCVVSSAQYYYSLPQMSVSLSSAAPHLSIIGPAGALAPGGETPCSVVLVAPDGGAPLAGTLRLSADSGTVVTPDTFPIQATPGQGVRLPFTLRAAASSSLGAQSSLRGTAVFSPESGESVTEAFEFTALAVPLSGVPLAEAEDFAEQSGGEVVVRDDKAGVSGKAFSHWGTKGHRLAWQINVPETGRYHLVIRYSSPNAAERTLWVDGKALTGAEGVRFPPTGGYGSSADEWSNLAVRLPDGQLAVWDLAAGPRTVTMESADGSGLNLDQIALVPVP